jgi:transposase
MAAEHTQHMQKSLSLMNLQIHHVLSDITGASGLAILDAIPIPAASGSRIAERRSRFSPRFPMVASL